MNSNRGQAAATAAASSDPLLNHADTLSSPATASASAAAGAAQLFDEFLKEDELDGSDDISDDSGHDGLPSKHAPLREQDRFLPIANIAKIMKRAIPDNGKIAKDSRECIQECVSEFISFITSEASDRCHQEKRKTINGDDILYAMLALGFDQYAEPLTLYLHKFRETTKTDRHMSGSGSGGSGGGAGGGGGSGDNSATAAAAAATTPTTITSFDDDDGGGGSGSAGAGADELSDESMMLFKSDNSADMPF